MQPLRADPPTIPDHEWVRCIGKGAYGEVWLARNALGTWRAVKIVHRGSFKEARPYEREFAGIRRFEPISRSHEGFVDILQVGRNDVGGWFYYIMELADPVTPIESPMMAESSIGSNSCSVSDLPRRYELGLDPSRTTDTQMTAYAPRTLAHDLHHVGRLPLSDCLQLGLTLTLALGHLHRHGLIHRDIKPSNIIYVGGVPKLADIGLVTEADGANTFVGTEGFVPPEGPTSFHSDLYALGKVLYEASMGKDRNEFPEPFSEIGIDSESVALMELNAVLLQACAQDPQSRYRSAEEMHADLALLHSGGSVKRQRQIAGQLRFVQRIGLLIGAIAAAISLGWWWQVRQTQQVRELVIERSRLADDNARMADENHRRLIRLAVANGIREIDQGDLGAALLHLTDALGPTTNNPSDASRQRIRIQQLLAVHPRLLEVLPHPAPVRRAEFSPDGGLVATLCDDGYLRVWSVDQLGGPAVSLTLLGSAEFLRFTQDGRQIFVVELNASGEPTRASLRDRWTGQPRHPPFDGITCAALSPNDRWLAIAWPGGTLDLLDASTGQPVARSTGHTDRVEMLSFGPNSDFLVSASRDRSVRRWRVPSGELIGAPLRHNYPVAQVLIDAEGSRLATATAAAEYNDPIQFQTWNLTTGQPLGAALLGWGRHALLAFDRSGQRFLTVDREPVARVWNVDAHTPVLPPLITGSPVRCLDFSPDGAWLALGGDDGTVRLFDAETGRATLTPLHQTGSIRSVQFDMDSRRLLTAGEDGVVRIWDIVSQHADRSRQFPTPVRPRVTLANDMTRVMLAASGPDRLFLVDPTSPGLEAELLETTTTSGWGVLVADAAGRQCAHVTGPEGYRDLRRGLPQVPDLVELWRHEGSAVRRLALPHPATVRNAFFHRDGSRVLTVSVDGIGRIWRTIDGTLDRAYRWPSEDTQWLAVDPDFRVAVTLAGDEKSWRMVFRNLASGASIRTAPEHNPDVRMAAFSPDGERVGIFGGRQSPRIWMVVTGDPASPPLNHGGVVSFLDWSPDGRRVVTAGESPEVKVWDAFTGRPALPSLVMGSRPVERARFSPDGQFIAARCDEDLVRVWDAATGEALTPAIRHRDTVRDVFITANRQLVSIQNSGEIRVWNLSQVIGSAEDLSRYARLLNGQGPSTRSPDPLDGPLAAIDELRHLKTHHPEWLVPIPFTDSEGDQGVDERPATLGRARTQVYHWERQLQRSPDDSQLRARLNRERSFLIPPRDPLVPPRMLDLSRVYTHSFELLPRGDFAALPRGRVTLAGTEFDVRGLVLLDHRAGRPEAAGPFHPSAMIEVGGRCRALHFLMATLDDPLVEDAVVARWLVHEADGSLQEWPVIYGRHVRDLWWRPSREPLEATGAALAWRGIAAIGNLPGTDGVRLFKVTWTNPRPELGIARLEFRVGETSMKPIVVAISAE